MIDGELNLFFRYNDSVFYLKNPCSSFISSWIDEIIDILPNPKSLRTFIENLRCACQLAPVLNVIPVMSNGDILSEIRRSKLASMN